MEEQEKTKIRKIKTAQFGELEVEEQYIFRFEEGVLGFENLKEFVLISEEDSDPFKWLISVDEPAVGFPLISPWHIDVEYNPGKKFNLEKQVLFVVITLGDESGAITANMKAPIVLNIENQTGEQVILPKDKYSTTHLIYQKET